MADRQGLPDAAAGPLTVADLETIARSRHWGLITPGCTGFDNVPVLEPVGEGRWRIGYKERGKVDWDATTLPESEAVTIVYSQLLRYHAPEELDR